MLFFQNSYTKTHLFIQKLEVFYARFKKKYYLCPLKQLLLKSKL